MSNEDLDFVKVKTKEAALSFYGTYNNSAPQKLSNDEFIPLKKLSEKKNLIIQIFDKGNSALTVGRQGYIKKMNNVINNQKNLP